MLTTDIFSALPSFAVAARLGSFTKAAQALGVTQPAVSHAMRNLERNLGVALFERQPKSVRLSPAGQQFYEQISVGLQQLEQAVDAVQHFSRPAQVSLAVSTATATWWLLPRIARFKLRHPEVEIRCLTTDTDLDLDKEQIDLAITLGAARTFNLTYHHFVDEEIFPVCSPAYLQQHPEFRQLSDLAHMQLLHLEERYSPRMDWGRWLRHFNATPTQPHGLSFNDYSVVVQAVLEGQGVALGWAHLVAPLLASGQLVRPLAETLKTQEPLYIVASRRRGLTPEAQLLHDWLVEEARPVAVDGEGVSHVAIR